VCKGEKLKIYGGGGVSYNWNNNSFIGDTLTVTYLMSQVGTFSYSVLGTDANGCKNDTILYVKVNSCTGITEINGAMSGLISVYPNPSRGEFYITSETNATVKLMNELGQVIRTFNLTDTNKRQIQISELAKGIYFVIAENDLQLSKHKVIVE
jgi:hypothetical protein